MLYNLKLVIYVGSVFLVAHVPRLLHVHGHGLVVLLDAAFAVATEGVAAKV